MLGPEGRLTVRGSRDDGVFIGLWLDITHGRGSLVVFRMYPPFRLRLVGTSLFDRAVSERI